MKLKLGIKSIIKYLYLLLIIALLFLLNLTYNFTKKNVLGAINPGDALEYFQNRKYSEDLNVKKFDEIIEKIKQKNNNDIAPMKIKNSSENFASSTNDF